MKYEAPRCGKPNFTCPHCSTYAQMNWDTMGKGGDLYFYIATCLSCNQPNVWSVDSQFYSFNSLVSIPEPNTFNENDTHLIYPLTSRNPMPNQDIPIDCKKDYMEARDIADLSPRAAAGLLRLCLQKILIELTGINNIHDAISKLKKDGEPEGLIQALDSIRIFGNNSVHPNKLEIDNLDDADIVSLLFELINYIIEEKITRPKKTADFYAKLPPEKRILNDEKE